MNLRTQSGWPMIALVAASMAFAVYTVDQSTRNSHDAPAAISALDGRVSAEACYDCHSEISQRYATAPHNRTLRSGKNPEVIAAFNGKSAQLNGHNVSFHSINDQLWSAHDAMPFERQVDWVFGSGQHAMTPVTIDTDPDGHPRLTQLSGSILNDGKLGPTPGIGVVSSKEDLIHKLGEATLASHGEVSDAASTRRCFGCHVSGLPVSDGRIDLNAMIPNIDCTRCHPGAARHARSGGEVNVTLDWAELSPLESINRCGECHRRADEFTPDELRPEFTHLVRFSPVGMAMSPCFASTQVRPRDGVGPKGQIPFRIGSHPQHPLPPSTDDFPRFDCVTCHDPHAVASKDPKHYNTSCLACHDFAADAHSVGSDNRIQKIKAGPCSVQPVDSSCISCHMPKVESGEGLFFTDHWIRVRGATDP